MGAYDIFEIVVTGKGAHAAMPYTGKDPMLFAAHAISALQTIVSRNLHPLDAGVVSVTQVHGGDTWNVIPEEVVLRGTVRTFRKRGAGPDRGAHARHRRRARRDLRDDGDGALRAALSGDGEHRTPRPARGGRGRARSSAPTTSRPIRCRTWAARTSRSCCSAKPGCYVWLGAGRGPDTPNVHNPHYDFNDDALPIGASYWVTLAEQQLAPA